ncbi:ABC transporter ATP-binding protein [Anaerocolumna sp. AGMB13025]|uniref:ABC transporter ATP-binding protein n=1 Tax=Anaerocolumna sp. AGMB13025 TaxID=3039116 RepID=UPI00241E7EC1|nr:ABC transporter ATP-binding protein [Anaerocolumna sp. AGMB13025]WFR56120.1 ABC transporter ATP-binding protein [Anaerocolumna sp. AGMB13025]
MENTNTEILKSVDLEIFQDEFVAIMGASGSGKSTLLGILAGVDSEYEGNVNVLGKDIKDLDDDQLTQFRNKNIGIIFQAFNLLPDINIIENVKVPLYFSNNKLSGNEKAKELLRMVGLEGKEKLFPRQLSGGEQQRVAIARALVNSPSVVFADEPTGALDKVNGEMIIKLLKEGREKKNMTIVMVTHDYSLATQADRTICIEDGKIINKKE